MAFGAILGQKAGGLFPQITTNLTPPESNITVTATLGTTSVSANSVDGVAVLKVPSAGNWTVSAEDQSANVNVTEEYSVSLQLTRYQTLFSFSEGSIIKINENGSPVEFYVAKHNYESELNGTGRTLMVRKDCWGETEWNDENKNAWSASTVKALLNDGYIGELDSNVKNAIGVTTYRYTRGNLDNTLLTRSDAVFLLSLTELGESNADANVEGSVLPIASKLLSVKYNGRSSEQWTRSPDITTDYSVFIINEYGDINIAGLNVNRGTRPVFTLPSTTFVDDNNNIIFP